MATHSYRQHSICSCLPLCALANFTDTPVSKYDCQSPTLTKPFKALLSHSFTPEPCAGLWVLSTFSSPAICHFNSIIKPSLFCSLSPTMWKSRECERHSLDALQKMCVCVFADFICHRVSKDLQIFKKNVYKLLFSGFCPTISNVGIRVSNIFHNSINHSGNCCLSCMSH